MQSGLRMSNGDSLGLWRLSPNGKAEVQIDVRALRMKAEGTRALGSSSSVPGDAELVSRVFEMSNGESMEAKSGALKAEP
jgi:hypothetical protein